MRKCKTSNLLELGNKFSTNEGKIKFKAFLNSPRFKLKISLVEIKALIAIKDICLVLFLITSSVSFNEAISFSLNRIE